MSLLREIQNGAVDGSTDLETLLRKCRILASRLQNDELKSWVQSELDGYANNAIVPEYRIIHCNALGNFSGYFGSGLKNAPIPESCIPEKHRDELTIMKLREGIGALKALSGDSVPSMLQIDWPADAYRLFGTQIYANMNLMQAWLVVPKTAVIGILSTVRNRILNFVLEIEAANPDAGEASPDIKPIPEEKVSQIVYNYIYGNVGSVASGHGISQLTKNIVIAGNFESLAELLKAHGFNETDVSELEDALSKEPNAQKSDFGPRVAAWIGKAVARVAEGGMQVSTSVASKVLADALKAYYGI